MTAPAPQTITPCGSCGMTFGATRHHLCSRDVILALTEALQAGAV